jgi:hypothetical protein
MSTFVSHADASEPQRHEQKKMQECFKCKAAGFPNQLIGFEKIGENPTTNKGVWRLIDENGAEHKHRYPSALDAQQPQYDQQFTKSNNNVVNTGNTNRPFFRRKRIVDIETVANIEEARKLLSQGWDFQASYPATLANIPHYILVKKE